MNTLNFTKPSHYLLCGMLIIGLSACSDDKPATVQPSTASSETGTHAAPNFDHAHGPEVTDLQKHKFEHDFAAQCVERELNNSQNNIDAAEKINKSCECIATYIMKDLTAQEAEKFINEHEHPQSLRIKYEAAAFHCLQTKAHLPEPKIVDNTN